MASHAGLSKKHSPLQKAHYQAYRTENRALKNLIRRLKTRVRRGQARITRRNRINAKKCKAVYGTTQFIIHCKPDAGAISALKKLRVSV